MKKIPVPLLVALYIILTVVILYFGRGLLIPLAFGAIFAMLLNPVDRRLDNLGLPRYVSALLSVSIILLIVFVFFSVFGWQVNELLSEPEEIKEAITEKTAETKDFLYEQFGISNERVNNYARRAWQNIKSNTSSVLGTTTGAFSSFLLSLIYAVLLLGEKERLKNFMFKISEDKETAQETVIESGEVVQKYLTGKLFVTAILAVAYAVGFLLAGIPYAVLLAIFAAVLSFIPYIGNLIGGGIACLITLATGGTITDVLLIFAIMSIAQVAESYVLTPWIIGDNIDLNPLFAILCVIGFTLVWGAAGSIIALPLTGALKVIFDKTERYAPLAYLMGNRQEE